MSTPQRLAAIEAQQARIVALLEGLSAEVHRQVEADEEVRRTIFGDGNGHKGLVVKIDRLEQDSTRARWLWRAVVGALVPLIVAAAWAAVK